MISYTHYPNDDKDKYYISKKEFVNMIKYNTTRPIHEIIDKYNCKLYLNINNIPEDNNTLIFRLVNDLLYALITSKPEYSKKFDISKYIITRNFYSKHRGLSYHVIIPISIVQSDIKYYISYFLCRFPEYIPYIDLSVYDKKMFRTINSFDYRPYYNYNKSIHQVFLIGDNLCTFVSDDILSMTVVSITDECLEYKDLDKLKIGFIHYKNLSNVNIL